MKVLLITGASSDVGIELLRKMVHKYDFVWVHYHKMNERLMDVYKGMPERIGLVQADFLEQQDTRELVEEIMQKQKIPNHIIHLPAEKYLLSNFHQTDWSVYEKNLEVSLRSAVILLKAFIPYLIRSGDGRVVFMLSECTCNNPPAYTAHYTVTKYALLGLVKELAVEYGKKGLMVNAISPGMMETKFLDRISHHIKEKNAADTPSGKNIMVEELVDVFQLLLFGNCRISGQNIAVESL